MLSPVQVLVIKELMLPVGSADCFMQKNSHIANILYRHLQGQELSAEEQHTLDQWLTNNPERQALPGQLTSEAQLREYLAIRFNEPAVEEAYNRFTQKVQVKPVKRIPVYRWLAAASILLIAGIAAYYISTGKNKEPSMVQAMAPAEKIQPGKDGAILTLADGSTVLLDSLGNGLITHQGKTIVKVEGGQLVYDASAADNEVLYNTITTPRGRQYDMVLPDGSKVWLNAASSIHFPTRFTADERNVTITGEVYFEVAAAKNAGNPVKFTVNAGDTKVEVTGTKFNVMAYGDEEAIKTTLLEGSVNIIYEGKNKKIQPGEQAICSAGNVKVEDQAYPERAIAWKNGFFDFDNEALEVIMRQLVRWYDINVAYNGAAAGLHYGGIIKRESDISEILKILTAAGGVAFTIEGKKVTVKLL